MRARFRLCAGLAALAGTAVLGLAAQAAPAGAAAASERIAFESARDGNWEIYDAAT